MSNAKGPSGLAVNAAFLREIKEDNRRLHELIDETRLALARPELVARHRRRAGELLSELRDQLAMHFALEEAYGYFDEAIRFAPRFSSQAARLKAQHSELFTQLNELTEYAQQQNGSASKWANQVCKRFTEFNTHFLGHEQAEEQLILDVFDNDIGGGD